MEFFKKNKYKMAVIALVVMLISVISQPTLAYYVLQGTSTSIVTTGKVEISILETLDGEPYEGNVNIAPGSVIHKGLYVQNTGGHPCWLRIKLTKHGAVSGKNANDIIRLNISADRWLYHEGYYYYKSILAENTTSLCLYDQVSIVADGTETGRDYSNRSVFMDIQAEAIQSENNQRISYLGTSADISKVWPSGLDIRTGEVRP